MKVIQLAILITAIFAGVELTSADRNDLGASCSTNFYEMEKSLLTNTDNRYSLLEAFYPPREAHPVTVKVVYSFAGAEEEETADLKVWYWSDSEFYLIQPLPVFQCSSLLFSNLAYRGRKELKVQLDYNCSTAREEFFKKLTTKMKLYAQSATTGPEARTPMMSDSYIAVAASVEEISSDSLQHNFARVWIHFTLAIFPLGTLIMLCLCDPFQHALRDKSWYALEDEHSHGSVAAIMQISILLISFVFFLDIAGIYFTVTSELIFHDSNSAFYLSTVTGVLIDFLAFAWLVVVLCWTVMVEVVSWRRNVHLGERPEVTKKLMMSLVLAALLCLTNHVHFIILAFISDPFHAGSMTITYVIFFIFFFITLRQVYNRVVLHSNKRPTVVSSKKLCQTCSKKQAVLNGESSSLLIDHGEHDCNCFIPGPSSHIPFNTRVVLLSLVGIVPLIAMYLGTAILLFFTLPITKSIENSPSQVFTIYQGTGIIIASLLTYNILLRPDGFSVVKVVERLAKRLQLPQKSNYWNRLTDEEKFAKVVSTILEGKMQKPPSPAASPVGSEGSSGKDNGKAPETIANRESNGDTECFLNSKAAETNF